MAPPTFLCSLKGGPSGVQFKSPYHALLDGGVEWEHFAPVRAGDRITVTQRTADLYEKTGRLGSMLFQVIEYRYVNQLDKPVAIQRNTLITYDSANPGSQTDVDRSHSEQSEGSGEEPTLPQQICFEEVREGLELPTLPKRPTTRQLVKYAGAAGDYYEVHYDLNRARADGLPNVIVHGALKSAFLAQLVTGWIGEWGTLKRIAVQYRGLDFPADLILCKGMVTSKNAEGGENLVECEVWTEGHNREPTTRGSAVAALPSKEHMRATPSL